MFNAYSSLKMVLFIMHIQKYSAAFLKTFSTNPKTRCSSEQNHKGYIALVVTIHPALLLKNTYTEV